MGIRDYKCWDYGIVAALVPKYQIHCSARQNSWLHIVQERSNRERGEDRSCLTPWQAPKDKCIRLDRLLVAGTAISVVPFCKCVPSSYSGIGTCSSWCASKIKGNEERFSIFMYNFVNILGKFHKYRKYVALKIKVDSIILFFLQYFNIRLK